MKMVECKKGMYVTTEDGNYGQIMDTLPTRGLVRVRIVEVGRRDVTVSYTPEELSKA